MDWFIGFGSNSVYLYRIEDFEMVVLDSGFDYDRSGCCVLVCDLDCEHFWGLGCALMLVSSFGSVGFIFFEGSVHLVK